MSDGNTISYPPDAMRTTAGKIRNNATTALNNHESYWSLIQTCISPLPGFMQSALNAVLNPHNERLRASFQWQMDYADLLEKAAGEMEAQDNTTKRSFT